MLLRKREEIASLHTKVADLQSDNGLLREQLRRVLDNCQCQIATIDKKDLKPPQMLVKEIASKLYEEKKNVVENKDYTRSEFIDSL